MFPTVRTCCDTSSELSLASNPRDALYNNFLLSVKVLYNGFAFKLQFKNSGISTMMKTGYILKKMTLRATDAVWEERVLLTFVFQVGRSHRDLKSEIS